MKNQIVVLLMMFTLVSLVSCTKDGGYNTNTQTPLVKSITQQITSTLIGNKYAKEDLYYDSKGRITSIVDSANPGNKLLYTYTSDKQFSVDIYGSNVLEIHNILLLNSNG